MILNQQLLFRETVSLLISSLAQDPVTCYASIPNSPDICLYPLVGPLGITSHAGTITQRSRYVRLRTACVNAIIHAMLSGSTLNICTDTVTLPGTKSSFLIRLK